MYTTLNHRSPVQWLVRKGVGVLPTAGNEAVTSEWRAADILVWNTEVNENHSQLPTQEQRTKTLGTCLSSMYTCVPSCEIPAVQGRLSHHSMPEGLHGHQISDAWLCLLLHRSLFWNLITNAHPCWTTSFRISSATQGEDICSVVNPLWTCPCWDAIFAQQPHTCGFVSISGKVTLSAQGSHTRTHNGLAAQRKSEAARNWTSPYLTVVSL